MENSVQQQTLELLIRQEMLLSGLYEVFAGQFPPYRRFWHEMSGDESRHASWLKQLAEAQKKEAVFFDHGKTNPRTLNTFIEHLENTIRKAREGNLTLIQAVALALDFERSLIEKNAFARFSSSSMHNRAIIEKLISETRDHIQRVEAMAEIVRGGEQA